VTEPYALKWDPELVKNMDTGLVVCPDSGHTMTLKEGPYGLFYSCGGFPACMTTHPAYQEGPHVGQPDGIILSQKAREVRQRCKDLIREKFPTQKDFFAWKDRTMKTKVAVKNMTASTLNDLLSKLEKARTRK
jgi:ssDNA-binding Zn-finger/Zn-ribbon topoisomerase 1